MAANLVLHYKGKHSLGVSEEYDAEKNAGSKRGELTGSCRALHSGVMISFIERKDSLLRFPYQNERGCSRRSK
jgi:hypothetical protein